MWEEGKYEGKVGKENHLRPTKVTKERSKEWDLKLISLKLSVHMSSGKFLYILKSKIKDKKQ